MRTNDKNELIKNIDRLKTTLNGAIRIRKNLGINTVNPVNGVKLKLRVKILRFTKKARIITLK